MTMTTLITLTAEEVAFFERCQRVRAYLMAQSEYQLLKPEAQRWAFVQWLVNQGRLTDD